MITDDDNSVLLLLTSVRNWGDNFYASTPYLYGNFSLTPPLCLETCQEVNLAFKLGINVLDRGCGSLAGRIIRKAFLMAEELVQLEGPASIWNLLELLHYMILVRQFELLQSLVAHLVALAAHGLPLSHPLNTILRIVRAAIAKSACLTPQGTTPSDRNDSDASIACDTDPNNSLDTFLSMIRRAWTLNAEHLFDRFDDRLFPHYIRVHWDCCTIEPPRAIIGAAKHWLTRAAFHDTSATNFSTTKDPGVLYTSSIVALRNHADSILERDANMSGDTTAMLRILASLVTAKVLDDWAKITDPADFKIMEILDISRKQAGNFAHAVRTSTDLQVDIEGDVPLDTVHRAGSIVHILEYAKDETDLRVIWELFVLEDALTANGQHQRALTTRRKAYGRLQQYVEDIAQDTA
ncbi:hypothetical protein K461DRAFT_280305 [Myriangium duriaei CBS 260.36]|uniref:Uncharacterized protein n=1 Tax=Myriangium duriaei CBS 260.36 TaxID=1168546 RepID=A0A9P4IYZ5_9PEZI|nr:hypothetical protein K461DRAFT_280305 [Myriangium duriaei CBS 260.36]